MAFANDDLSEEERARFGRMYDDARPLASVTTSNQLPKLLFCSSIAKWQ